MNIETDHDRPTSGQDHPATAAIPDPEYVPPSSPAREEADATVPVAEVPDVVQEDDDFVESAQDAVEDIRSESLVTNHFRI